MLIKLQEIIDKDLSNDPDCIKGRKKTVQVSGMSKKTEIQVQCLHIAFHSSKINDV